MLFKFTKNLFCNSTVLQKHKMIISIVGVPNSGKSTLFNMLTGEKNSFVHPEAGITRDCLQKTVYDTLDFPIRFYDTPGIDSLTDRQDDISDMDKQILNNVKNVIQKSDIIFYVIDGKNGTSVADNKVKQWLMDNFPGKQIAVICNKCDSEEDLFEAYNVAYSFWDSKKIMFISAIDGGNIHEVWSYIKDETSDDIVKAYQQRLEQRKSKIDVYKQEWLAEMKKAKKEDTEYEEEEASYVFDKINQRVIYYSELDDDYPQMQNLIMLPKLSEVSGISYENSRKNLQIKVAVIGKPNSGKSTFFNKIQSETQSLTSNVPHTTRDVIKVEQTYKGKKMLFIDTAGIQRKLLKNKGSVSEQIMYRNFREINEAQIHIIIIDALNAFRMDDMSLIQKSNEEGRGVIVVVNKWDTIEEKHSQKAMQYMIKSIQGYLGSEKNIPMLFVSSLTGFGLKNLKDTILTIYEKWNARISTALLNNWLQKFKKIQDNDYKSMIKKQTAMNILYVTQIKTRPPTFALFVNDIEYFKDHNTKHIKSSLIEEFQLQGVAIKILYRGSVYKTYKKQLVSLSQQFKRKKMDQKVNQ